MEIFFVYLFLINALGFLIMSIDKRRAKKNLWRIPERTLLTVAALGGGLGVLWGMHLLRHKTRKIVFSVGIPVLFVFQVLLLILCEILVNNV